NQVWKNRSAMRLAELRSERNVRPRFLYRCAYRMVLTQRLGVPELRKPRRDDTRRTFKLERIGEGIRIGEGAPRLPRQKISVLPVKLPQSYRVPVVVAQEIELEIDLDLFPAVVQRALPRLPRESRGAHRYRRILGMRGGCRGETRRNIGAVIISGKVQVVEE